MQIDDSYVSKEYDEYLHDFCENRPRWEVILSNGEKIWQDDERPGTTLPAWERLRNYCYANDLHITNLKIAFRSNTKPLPENKDGYYYRKMARCFFGGKPKEHFIVGYVENGVIQATIFSVPEILVDSVEERAIDLEDISLVLKKDLIEAERKKL